MAKDLNLCQFIGRLGKDPEIKAMASGTLVANFSIACNDDYNDKQTGQKVEQTEWINASAFGKLAEIMQQYVKKGDPVYISGKMQTRKSTDQTGNDRYYTSVLVNQLQMLGGKQGNSPAQGSNESSVPTQPEFDDDVPF
ncbi:MAG: single-stranded DNA-binding protein [Pseudomonadota bacterium]